MTAEPRTHDDWLDSAALYAIDALSADERAAFEGHLRSCADCRAEVASLGPVNEALAGAVPQLDPPFALRQRVMELALGTASPKSAGFESASGVTRPSRLETGGARSWWPVAATLIATVGLGVYTYSLQSRLTTTQRHLDVLSASDSTRVELSGGAPAPNASGRADWSRSRGLAISTDNLPAVAPGRTYQVWLLTSGAPVSAGLLRPDASGRSTVVYTDLPPGVQATGVALSEEPEGGVPAPTGMIYLVGQLARAPVPG
jgi:anti-sigma-K factor RskA